jgi:hypothetical protein
VERGDRPFRVGERDQRMEGPDLRAGRHRRGEDLGAERSAGVDHRLPAVHPEGAGERRHGIIWDRQDDQLDLVEDRLRVGEDPGDVDQRAKALAPFRVATGDRVDGPAGARQRDAEGGPDRARPDDADDRWLTRGGMHVRMDVVIRVGLVTVAVAARRRRVEVDPGGGDGRLLLRPLLLPVALGVVAGQVAPRPHGRSWVIVRSSRDSIHRV